MILDIEPTTLEKVAANLQIIVDMLLEKEVVMPEVSHTMSSDNVDRDRISMYGSDKGLDGESYRNFFSHSGENCWVSAYRFADNLPPKQEVHKRTFNKELGDLIDLANSTGIEEEFIAPLKTTRKALTENLLTHNKGKMNA